MKPTERFSDRVEDYVRYRPRYPRAAVEVLRRETGLTPGWSVADIGSGTGLAAELFLDNGNPVAGVEPNREMRDAAEARLAGRPGFRSVDGSAEATGLEAGSFDMVVVAQAFHWFDPAASRRELARILKPPGWAVLIWNTRRTEATAFLRDYESLLVRHGTDYSEVRHDRIDSDRLARFFGGAYERRIVANEQVLDLDGLKGRLLSSSYTPPEGDPRRAPLLRDVERIFGEHQQDGDVIIEYDTEIYIGRLLEPTGPERPTT
jgi:SAM-dependent methyltransferase